MHACSHIPETQLQPPMPMPSPAASPVVPRWTGEGTHHREGNGLAWYPQLKMKWSPALPRALS